MVRQFDSDVVDVHLSWTHSIALSNSRIHPFGFLPLEIGSGRQWDNFRECVDIGTLKRSKRNHQNVEHTLAHTDVTILKDDLTLPGVNARGFLVHRANLPRSVAEPKQRSFSPQALIPVCPTVFSPFLKMLIAAL